MLNAITGGECDYVYYDGKQYYVDTSFTLDHGWETMIFQSCDHKVTDWGDLYCERYMTRNEALARHKYIIEHLNEFI